MKVSPGPESAGHPDVFALGDMVSLTDANGVLVPGLAPAAMQMGVTRQRSSSPNCR